MSPTTEFALHCTQFDIFYPFAKFPHFYFPLIDIYGIFHAKVTHGKNFHLFLSHVAAKPLRRDICLPNFR